MSLQPEDQSPQTLHRLHYILLFSSVHRYGTTLDQRSKGSQTLSGMARFSVKQNRKLPALYSPWVAAASSSLHWSSSSPSEWPSPSRSYRRWSRRQRPHWRWAQLLSDSLDHHQSPQAGPQPLSQGGLHLWWRGQSAVQRHVRVDLVRVLDLQVLLCRPRKFWPLVRFRRPERSQSCPGGLWESYFV